jgi:SAM-dependent methyltransferase
MASAPTGSASLTQPDYWWYRARSELLRTALAPYMGRPTRALDVGSADGPSVDWMHGDHERFALDVDPRGLRPGSGVCGSATALPFADASFDLVGAFDVVEHCDPEAQAFAELARVLVPGGRLLLSVPAYQWAWSDHDVRAGHYRRYTLRRLERAVRAAGLHVERSTYAFTSVFPLFAAERMARRLRRTSAESGPQQLTEVSPTVESVLLGLCRVDRRLLRRHDLPFGSSVLLAATKPRG